MKKLLVTGASGFLGWHLCQLAKQEWEDIKNTLPDNIELIGEFNHAWGTEYNGFLMFQSETSDIFFEWWSGFKDKIRWYVEKTHTIVARRR